MWWLGAQTDQNRPPGAILGPCGGWGPKLAKIEVCKPFQFSCSITNPFSCSIKCKPFQFNSVVRLNANPVDERTIWKLILSISGACWPNGLKLAKIDLLGRFWSHVVAGGPNLPKSTSWGYSGAMWWLGAHPTPAYCEPSLGCTKRHESLANIE